MSFENTKSTVSLNSLENTTNDEKKAEKNLEVFLRIKPDPNLEELYHLERDEILISKPLKTKDNEKITFANVCRKYKFSKIFSNFATQENIFDDIVKPKIDKFITGENCSVLMYGASGSGKTFTIIGTDKQPGIIPRALNYLFCIVSKFEDKNNYKLLPNGKIVQINLSAAFSENKLLHALLSQEINKNMDFHISNFRCMQEKLKEDIKIDIEPNSSFGVWVSFAEVYNENIHDLLVAPYNTNMKKTLPLRNSKDKIYIDNLTTVKVHSALEAYQILQIGLENLKYADTKVNSHSSRSHAIFSIKLVKSMNVNNESYSLLSYFNFCDLAGAERNKKTMNVGQRLQESNCINTSLLVLGKCIQSIRDCQQKTDKTLVPYRESKLTQLLKNGLSGKEDISMIVNINPSKQMYNETQHVLKFSAIAKEIVLERTESSCNYQSFANQINLRSTDINNMKPPRIDVNTINDINTLHELNCLRKQIEEESRFGYVVKNEVKREILLNALAERKALIQLYEKKYQERQKEHERDLKKRMNDLRNELKPNDSIISLDSSTDCELSENDDVIVISSSDENDEDVNIESLRFKELQFDRDIDEHHRLIKILKDEINRLRIEGEATKVEINELQKVVKEREWEILTLKEERHNELKTSL